MHQCPKPDRTQQLLWDGHDTAINSPGSLGGSVFSSGTTWFGADVAVVSWALVGSVLKAEVLPLAGTERDLYV